MDHEAHTKDFKTEHGESEVFKTACDANENGEDDAPEARSDAVDVIDVAGVGNGEVVDCLEVVIEGRIPAVEADEEEGGEEAGTDDGAIGEQVEWYEGFACDELFVEGEEEEEEGSQGEHGDNEGGFVAFCLVGC